MIAQASPNPLTPDEYLQFLTESLADLFWALSKQTQAICSQTNKKQERED